MIAKVKDPENPSGKFELAGAAAEEQMAFYLRRAFGEKPDVLVINDLRLAADDDCAQIDHLVLHPFGMFIVESKSVSGEVTVNEHGEWVRRWGGQRTGMPSPIQQARRQGEFLRDLLIKNKDTLRDKRLMGKVQPGFKYCPIGICVAISDRGIINRQGANPPELLKADLVCDRIRDEIERHRKASGLLSRPDGDYGLWELKPQELQRVKDFLLQGHCPRTSGGAQEPASTPVRQPPPPLAVAKPATAEKVKSPATATVCKHCGSGDLVGTYGKYGYYLKCQACDKNTPIDHSCTCCGKKARIRKQGTRFDRVCEACGREALVWQNSAVT